MSESNPIATWLHLGPGAAVCVTISIPGTYKRLSLQADQVRRLRSALERACDRIEADDADRFSLQSINLMDGVSG